MVKVKGRYGEPHLRPVFVYALCRTATYDVAGASQGYPKKKIKEITVSLWTGLNIALKNQFTQHWLREDT